MLDILAASYKNIGPLYEQAVSLSFHPGTYLVNAPVGTGKSFLFFDGVIFSLFKYSGRSMCNRRSDKAYTQLLFSAVGEYRLICRNITPTPKGGDSVKSVLYRIKMSENEIQNILADKGIVFDAVLSEMFVSVSEKVPTSSEKEVDRLLQDILPPREVLLSAHFLMQDADNIFELPPNQRLDVLKHIFGFIGIDHAKESLRDKKKELQTKVALKADTTELEKTFSTTLEDIYTLVRSYDPLDSMDETLKKGMEELLAQPVIKDLSLVVEKIHIQGFVRDSVQDTIHQIQERLASMEKEYIQQSTTYEQTRKQAKTCNTTLQEMQADLRSAQKQQKTAEVYMDNYQKQQATRDQLIKKRDVLQTSMQQRLQQYHDRFVAIDKGDRETFPQMIRYLDTVIAEGKLIQQQIDTHTEQHESLHQEVTKLEQKIVHDQKRIASLTSVIEEQSRFFCDKIDGLCPYVETIKGASMETLHQQKAHHKKEYQQHTDERDIAKKKAVTLLKTITTLQQQKKMLRDRLQSLHRKEMYAAADLHDKDEQEYHKISTAIDAHAKEIAAHDTHVQEYRRLQTIIDHKTKDIHKQEKRCHEVARELEKQKELLAAYPQEYYDDLARLLERLLQLDTILVDVLTTYVQRKKEIALLEEEAEKVKHLYTIFSKELLVVVLQDFLPTMEKTINTYLQKVTSYTLHFVLEYSSQDVISLEVYIEDEKGRRKVRSLSGGQRSLLKLARIFSIATMLQLPFLFLDETITSLDAHTTVLVAKVLEDFATDVAGKLYIVTHATHIQALPIRDEQIMLEEYLS